MAGRIEDDSEFQAGRAELNQHLQSGNPDWGAYGGDSKPPKGSGCSIVSAALISGSGLAAAYLGHRYGVA